MDALTSRYRELSEPLIRYVMSFTNEMHLAEDIVSETFLRATKHCIVNNELPAKAWFYKVARNIAYDFIRKKGKFEFTELTEIIAAETADTSTNADPEASYEYSEQKGSLDFSLSKVPEPYKSVLILKEYDNLTYGDIAKIMGVSLDNVKVMLFRGRQKLRNIYRRNYENEV